MNQRPARLAALTLLVFAVAVAARAERHTERFERLLPVAAAPEVRLTNTNGGVSVETWDRAEVEVVAEKSLDSRSRADAEEALARIEILVRASGDRIEIETRQPPSSAGFFDWLFGRSRNAAVRYRLRVPGDARLDVRTVNGSVTTDGAAGAQVLRSTNGRIEVRAARRGVDAQTTNGSIQVEVTSAPEQLDIDLGSTNGSITLALPDGVRARVAARTVNGTVRSELPLTVQGGASRGRMAGDLNGGGRGSIQLRTTNGSIRIERATA